MLKTLLKNAVSFSIIFLLALLCFYSIKFSIVNHVNLPLINQIDNKVNKQHNAYTKYSIKKHSVWDIQTSEKEFRPIPQRFNDIDIEIGPTMVDDYAIYDVAQFLKIYPYKLEHSIKNGKLEISHEDQIISFGQILSPQSVQQILLIPSIVQNRFGHFYQIKHPLFHSIFKGNSKCLTLQTPSANTYANNNKFNRYLQIDQNSFAIISLAMNRVLIVQIYQCANQRQNSKVVAKKNYLVYKNQDEKQDSYKFQGFQIFRVRKGNSFGVQLLSYSKDIVTVAVFISGEKGEYQLGFTNKHIYKSHQIAHRKVNSNFVLQTQEPSSQLIKKSIFNVLSYGFLQLKKVYDRKKNWLKIFQIKPKNVSKTSSKIQVQVPVVAINKKQNALIQFSPSNESKMWKLGKYLHPTRIPVFSNEKNNELALQKLINSDEKEMKSLNQINFQFFQLNNVKLNDPKDIMKLTSEQNLKIERDQFYGIDPIVPNLQVNWLGLSSKQLFFYPQNKIKEQEYYLIRTQDGGLVSQGYKLKGKYDNLPLRKDQIIQSINSKPLQLIRGIFEIHAAYRHLISYPVTEKRVELIHGLNGKSIHTYYRKVKEGYVNNYIKIQNNEWFLNQYHPEHDASLLTKYELFSNASNIKQVLSIKRQYNFPGKITNILKSVDGYYYITSRSRESILMFIRVGINYMNNRMEKADGKYSGAFQQLMIDKELSKTYLQKGGFDFQQKMFILNTGIDKNQDDLESVEKIYLYDMLPYEIFVDNFSQGKQFYLFNVRNLFITYVDEYFMGIQNEAIGVFLLTLLFLFTVSVLFCFKSFKKVASKESEQGKKEGKESNNAPKQKADSPKKKKNKDKQKQH